MFVLICRSTNVGSSVIRTSKLFSWLLLSFVNITLCDSIRAFVHQARWKRKSNSPLFFWIFFIYKNLHIEPFNYIIKSVCFDFCSTNMGSSVIKTGRSEGSLLPYFYLLGCRYPLITYLSQNATTTEFQTVFWWLAEPLGSIHFGPYTLMSIFKGKTQMKLESKLEPSRVRKIKIPVKGLL